MSNETMDLVTVKYLEEKLNISEREARAIIKVFGLEDMPSVSLERGRPQKYYSRYHVDHLVAIIEEWKTKANAH